MRPVIVTVTLVLIAWLLFLAVGRPDQVVSAPAADTFPVRDPVSLASRFLGAPPTAAIQPSAPPSLGETRSFYVLNQSTSAYQAVDATNVHTSDHVYWWAQVGVPIDQATLERAAATFESTSLGVLTRLFGTLTFPAVSGQRVHVLNARTQGVGAYFSSVDMTPRSVHPYSNELALVVVNVDSFRPGSTTYDETLAHEIQHMIHWTLSPSSETWFDEGISELVASTVRGSPARGATFARRPDRALMAWSDEPGAFAAQYDASYLFAQYLADRFGLEAIGAMIRAGRPPAAIESYLARQSPPERFDELFGDWLVANLKDPERATRQVAYRYAQADPDVALVEQVGLTAEWSDSVSQYGTDYLDVVPGISAVEIRAAPTVKIAPVSGADSDLVWWANRADSMDARLTREVDLRSGTQAMLRFRTWFDTEQNFDHGYVAVSNDGGATWRAMEGLYTQAANPTGNAYGPSYTGKSGGEVEARWVDERIDLSAYAGQDILVRFEYITDQGTTRQGWLVDDIDIDGIGLARDSESDQASWQAEGFLRTSLAVPSRMLVQVIDGSGAATTVRRVWIDSGAPTTVPLTGRTVLSVSGVTPLTFEPMEYTVRAVP